MLYFLARVTALGIIIGSYFLAVSAEAAGGAGSANGSAGTTGGAGVAGNTGAGVDSSGNLSAGMNNSSTMSGISGNTGTIGAVAPTTSGALSNNNTTTGTGGTTTANSTGMTTGPGNWTAENQYWRNSFSTRPYATGRSYSTFEPAYQYGVTAFSQYHGQRFNDIDQAKLRAGWMQARGNSDLSWDQAQLAARDAYERLYNNSNNSAGTMNNNINPAR